MLCKKNDNEETFRALELLSKSGRLLSVLVSTDTHIEVKRSIGLSGKQFLRHSLLLLFHPKSM